MKRIAPSTITRSVLVLSILFSVLATDLCAQRGRRGGQERRGVRWAHDGKHVIEGRTWRDPITWKEVASTPRPPRERGIDTAKLFRKAVEEAGGDAPRAAFGAGGTRTTIPRTVPRHAGMRASGDGTKAAVIIDGELWAWSHEGGARRIKKGLEQVRRFEMSDDGSAVSYIAGHDLYIVRTKDGETHRLSDDGSDDLFYGELDWVYQEEVYGRGNFKATWWSPNSKHLAYLRIVERGVDTFQVIDHIPNALGVESIKYPKAGTTNPVATLHIANGETGKSVAVDLSKYEPEDEILIVRVGWTPEGDRCLFKVQNREQTWLDLNLADPKTGKVTTIIHENCEDGWVNVLSMPRWLEDGTFVWESERTGYKHLYRYDRTGKLVATISKGEWEVRNIIRLDEKGGWVAFYGTTPDYAIGENAYKATLDGKSLVKITGGPGAHRVSLNGDGSLVLDSVSAMDNPGAQYLRKTADASTVRTVFENSLPEGAKIPVHQKVKARDGEWLDVVYTLPRNFDPKEKYPVWISTYSGPDAPTIRDGWRGEARGSWYVLLNVNVRTASGRGMKYTKQCYKQFGVQELKDIEDAVDWLCDNHEWADRGSVGITGWSYGGFMTAYALTHSDYFKCGIAGAGVYNWQLYDTIYTERYMAKPQNNEDGYAISSVVEAAKNLKGQLLIVHGTMDDNVHAQNAIQFIHELQKAGKMNFEFMLYPKARHGVRSPHLQKLRQRFMEKYLRGSGE